MIADLSRITVQIFGVLILAGVIFGLIAPAGLIGVVRKVTSRPDGWVFAVVVRILLGAALLTAAQASRFPLAFTTLGWIAIAAAIGILLIGPARMQKLVDRVARMKPLTIRIWLGLGAVFAGFLLFAA
jgi:hypothetical protein